LKKAGLRAGFFVAADSSGDHVLVAKFRLSCGGSVTVFFAMLRYSFVT
jgi:hypothetical protein